ELIARSYLEGVDADGPHAEVVVHADLGDLCDENKGEVLRSMACDARITLSVERDGQPVAVGPPQESIPAKTRRLVGQRDKRRCRFPGCANRRFLHVHHIVHRVFHGTHRSDNLITLCTFHHRLLHVGGWRVRGDADGSVAFIRPDGRRLHERPPDLSGGETALPYVDARPITMAEGVPLDLVLAVDAILAAMPE
ncbi:MAG TPA: HNH endonuclease signature motif containing protein, partial [Acidimicrobiia bacterium]|nr:HNH endonuclease signature motif containing protein [Acidimicrobiia bacterium]